MTTRTELLELANANTHIGGVPELLTGITEAKGQLDLATWQLSIRAASATHEKEQSSYQSVGSFMVEAAVYESSSAKLATLFLTLACVLQNGGLAIEY